MRGWFAVVVGLLATALVVTLVVKNGDPVTVDLLVMVWPTKVWGAMVAAAVVGAGLSALLLVWPLLRMKMQARRQGKRMAELEQELHGLRTLPIASDVASPSSAQKV
ncbi:MAG: lipopolysaccharide assembly protein LapA domain-containing protein [Myxococcota bacterium]